MDNMDNKSKADIEGLIYFYRNTSEIDDGIRNSTIEILESYLNKIIEEESVRKRKSPNKSGVLQVDKDTGKVIEDFPTQKDALLAIGKDGKSGIGDALNGRTKTHAAYGYLWYFRDEYPGAAAALEAAKNIRK
jgi:hypothetical protein